MESEGRNIRVFIRDDDVDEDEPSLLELLELFLELEVPINLEIIPGLLTDSAVATLKRFQQQRPDLFELNQHGWLHINHEAAGRKCEFGISRSYDQQLSDIQLGKQKLESAFGASFSAVFTPPWNRCTEDTCRALEQLGFSAISRLQGKRTVNGYGFREISVTLDLFRWKNGAEMKAAGELAEELALQLRQFDRVGIMRHHKVMDEEAFAFVRNVLNELRQSSAISFHTCRSLIETDC